MATIRIRKGQTKQKHRIGYDPVFRLPLRALPRRASPASPALPHRACQAKPRPATPSLAPPRLPRQATPSPAKPRLPSQATPSHAQPRPAAPAKPSHASPRRACQAKPRQAPPSQAPPCLACRELNLVDRFPNFAEFLEMRILVLHANQFRHCASKNLFTMVRHRVLNSHVNTR